MTQPKIPDEFPKIIKDFVSDIKATFPEYQPFISKWWKEKDAFLDYDGTKEETEKAMKQSQENSIAFVFKFCLKKFPPRFFEILYQDEKMFKEDSDIDTEFLPYIHFKNLWECDISDKTKTTIWKYLQLILFSIVGTIENRDAFGDSAKLFESINEDEFKGKLEETLEQMKGIFEKQENDGVYVNEDGEDVEDGMNSNDSTNLPKAEDIHQHINGMLDGKLGKLAREIAEETAGDLNLDMNGVTDAKGVFQNLFKNPGKLMGLVKNVGEKLDTRIKSGEIKESELMQEASEMIQKMKGMPGMGDIQSMLSKMGLGGQKVNIPAMEAKLNQNIKTAKMKERMKEKLDAKRAATTLQELQGQIQSQQIQTQPVMNEDELIKMFNDSEETKETKSSKKNGKKNEKKKGTKN